MRPIIPDFISGARMNNKRRVVIAVGLIYLCIGIMGSILPVMFLLSFPTIHISSDSVAFFAYTIVVIIPCYFIAYGWFRGRSWGRRLMIGYNTLLLGYVTYAFLDSLIRDEKSITGPIIVALLGAYFVIGALLFVSMHQDVRTEMNS
jgi:putative Mn2+ efflux pump MntP